YRIIAQSVAIFLPPPSAKTENPRRRRRELLTPLAKPLVRSHFYGSERTLNDAKSLNFMTSYTHFDFAISRLCSLTINLHHVLIQ
ncbi:hypothetical protein ACV355_30580, partial [Pseudomonas aeruginosa]